MDVMETWEPVLTTGPLLGIAAAAVALILVMVIYFKVHAFIVLTIVSTLTALVAGIPLTIPATSARVVQAGGAVPTPVLR